MHLNQQTTSHARTVYVGGLPPTANELSVATFFSHVMDAIGGSTAGPGDAVVNVNMNREKQFALMEMRSVGEASNAMALDGIMFEGTHLRVRRPSDYIASMAATLGPSQPSPNLNLANVGLTPSSTSTGELESPDCFFFGGLPYFFTEAQIKELLESFGLLRCFELVKASENSEGFAFCVYQDVAVTDIACAALNGIRMDDITLTARRVNQGPNQLPEPELERALLHAQHNILMQRLQLLQLSDHTIATKVVCLTRAVTDEELKDDLMYGYIVDDMELEALRYGSFRRVIIPRPRADGEPSSGVGKVFMEFADVDGAKKAHAGMNAGWKFGEDPAAVFYPEDKFAQGDYDASC